MNDFSIKATISACIVAIISLFGISVASAQISEGVQIKPAIVEDKVDPGQVFPFTLEVTNISMADKTFYLNAQDITGLDDAGLPIFSTETELTQYEISTWIELPDTQIVLAANETKRIEFVVRVPRDAAPGAHFGGVFLDARPPKQRSNGAAVGLKVGTIINLRIKGDVNEEAQLREFSTGNIVYGSATGVDFNAKMANFGNVLLRPHGLIEITDMWGSKVGVVKVNDSGSGVFPGGEKVFTHIWEYDGFVFGRYQAVISMAYGEDERKTASAATSFWILPLKPMLIVLGSIFGLLLFFYVMIQSYIKRKLREMGGGRGGGELYARRNQSTAPKLLMIALGVLLLSMAFLVLLFLMFA